MASLKNSSGDEKMAASISADFIRRARARRIGASSSMTATLIGTVTDAAAFKSLPAFFIRFSRQLEFQSCPASRIAHRPQPALMILDDRTRDAQSDSHPVGLGSEEGIKHPRHNLRI